MKSSNKCNYCTILRLSGGALSSLIYEIVITIIVIIAAIQIARFVAKPAVQEVRIVE
jgi:hypothetical protein